MGKPFIIYALPRSRTAWLAHYLSYGDFHCAHEQLRHVRSIEDARAWLRQDFTGCAETAAAPWWQVVRAIRPDISVLVVRRPVGEVLESLIALPLGGVCSYEPDVLRRQLIRLDRRLERIARQPGVLEVQFCDLAKEETCADVFEHCLPYEHDPKWWALCADINIQANMRAMMRHFFAHQTQYAQAIVASKRQFRRTVRSDTVRFSAAEQGDDGISIQEEAFDTFWRDGQKLFAEHEKEVGPRDGVTLDINVEAIAALDRLGMAQIVTARCNGRLCGYFTASVAASLEDKTMLAATMGPFFVSRDFRGLGPKLERAALDRLRAKGVGEAFLRAGVRGSGPKLGILHKRMGAEEYGTLYRLNLKAA